MALRTVFKWGFGEPGFTSFWKCEFYFWRWPWTSVHNGCWWPLHRSLQTLNIYHSLKGTSSLAKTLATAPADPSHLKPEWSLENTMLSLPYLCLTPFDGFLSTVLLRAWSVDRYPCDVSKPRERTQIHSRHLETFIVTGRIILRLSNLIAKKFGLPYFRSFNFLAIHFYRSLQKYQPMTHAKLIVWTALAREPWRFWPCLPP